MRTLGGSAASLAVLAALALPLVAVGLTAAANGGYFPSAWGWPTLGFLLVALLTVLAVDRIAVGRLELVTLALLVAFAAWTLLSGAWSSSWHEPRLAAERTLVYASALLAVFLVASRRSAACLAAGVLGASTAVAVYALLTRLLPGTLEEYPPREGYQLATPIGYWNALGILAVLGVLLALGFGAGDLPRPTRALAAAPLPILVVTLYFTFSRGSWLSLAAGLCLTLVFARRRLRYLATVAALVLPAAVTVLVASHLTALTKVGATRHAARVAGAELAAVVAGCVVAAAAVGWLLATLEPRVRLGVHARRWIGAALAATVVLVALAALVRAGGPVEIVRDATRSFRSDLPETGGDLNRRLVSLSADGRGEYWRVAWLEVSAHPVLGGGAGSYERWWDRERRVQYETRNAHNLYLETLAELGPLGLLLLAGALAVPLVAAGRARDAALPATGAYCAFLVHAAVDWDWQIPAVALAGLLCGASILLAVRPETAGWRLSSRGRGTLVAVLLPLIALAVVEQIAHG